MATQSENVNDSAVVVDTGTSTVTGPDPPPLGGTTDNNNNNNNDEEQEVTTATTTLVTTGPPIVLTGLDVAAINKPPIQSRNTVERQFNRTEQGGSHAILQRCSDGGDNINCNTNINSSSSNNNNNNNWSVVARRRRRKQQPPSQPPPPLRRRNSNSSSSSNNSSNKKKKKKKKYNDPMATEDAATTAIPADEEDSVAKVMDPSQERMIDSTGTEDAAAVAAIPADDDDPVAKIMDPSQERVIDSTGTKDDTVARGGGGEHHHSSSNGITVGDNTIERVRSGMADHTGTDKDNAVDDIPADEEDTTTDGTNRPSSSTMSGPIILPEILPYLDEKSLIENSFANTEILTYLDERSLIEASFVNKQWHANCHSRSITKQPIVPYFRLTLDLSSEKDGIMNFVRNMKRNSRFRELKNKYERFELHLIGQNSGDKRTEHKHMCNAINSTSQILTSEEKTRIPRGTGDLFEREFEQKFLLVIDEMAHSICMNGIVSLVITISPEAKGHVGKYSPFRLLSKMFPQLRELKTTDNNGQLYGCYDDEFIWNCPHLEKLVIEKMNQELEWACDPMIDGASWGYLKELYIDNHTFLFDTYGRLNIEAAPFLAHISSVYDVLERLSIRNARYFADESPWSYLDDNYATINGKEIPQDALIKFVRNAPPALIWLRSDLSQENIKILKLERPNIDFVN